MGDSVRSFLFIPSENYKMLLTWIEIDELGERHVKEGFPVNGRNAHEYARRNCRRCHGRGTEPWDNGYVWSKYNRESINKRLIACDCVLRILQKIEDAKHV